MSSAAATTRGGRSERRERKGLFERHDRMIFGVPERFMGPRLVLIAATIILAAVVWVIDFAFQHLMEFIYAL